MTKRITLDDTLSFYKSLMEELGMTIDDDGFAYYDFGTNERIPVTVDDKHLFLPIRERLKSIDTEHTLAFHPLCQNVLRSDSQVFTALKKYIVIHLTTRIHKVILGLSELAINTEMHSSLSPRQASFLQDVVDYKKRTHTTTKQLLKQSSPNDIHKALVSLYVKKGGEVGDRKYSQACIVHFPMREAIAEAEGLTVFDSKFYSYKDKEATEKLLDYVMPDRIKYSQGSTSSVAPNLDALLKSFYKIGKHLNVLFDRYESVIPEFEGAQLDMDWWDLCEYFKEMSIQIPALNGSDGEPIRHSSDEESLLRQASNISTGAPASPPPPPAAPAPAPGGQIGFNAPPPQAPAPEPEPESSENGVSWHAHRQQQPQYGYPQPPNPYQQPQYGYPQPQQPQYGYPQPQQPQYGYPQPAPQPPAAWNQQPNYNSGYVSRADIAAGQNRTYQGQPQNTTPPWVVSENPQYGQRRW